MSGLRFGYRFLRLAGMAGLACLLAWIPSPAAAQLFSDGQSWSDLVSKAEEEGALYLSGPADPAWKRPLMQFQKQYPKIKIDYFQGHPRDFWPRLVHERQNDVYQWDVRVAGVDAMAYRVVREGSVLASLRNMLIHPEVIDPEAWVGGFDSIFADSDQSHIVNFGLVSYPVAWINRELVPESQVRTLHDLLNPELRGRISVPNMLHGSAIVNLGTLLRHPDFGEGYVRNVLIRQQAAIAPDPRNQVEWLITGRYPVAIAAVAPLIWARARHEVSHIQPLPGAKKFTSGHGSAMVFEKAPNPNAAKLFVNWLLTKSVQEYLAKQLKFNSRRIDVPAGNEAIAVDPLTIETYVPAQSEEMLPFFQKVVAMARELMGNQGAAPPQDGPRRIRQRSEDR